MELWIRSQNKHTFIKCDYITTLEKDIYGNTEYAIITEDELELGEYDSEKRLLEVLDEIQNILQPPANFIVSQHIDFADGKEGLIGVNVLKEEPKIERISDIIVYEMPKE